MKLGLRGVLLRVLRHPLVHFAAVGAVLFALRAVWPTPREPIVVTAERIRLMHADFQQRWGVPPAPEQLRALIEQAVEEEMLNREAGVLALGFQDDSVRRRLVEKARAVSRHPARSSEELYREALALGLDDDVVIRRLLAEKMRLVLQAEGTDAPISDAEALAYLERNRARFIQPEMVTFTHVFMSQSRHGEALSSVATAALDRLGTQPPSPAALDLSDPFPLGSELRSYTHSQLMGRFGSSFADAILALELGKWSGPIASPYGLHIVWVREHTPARLPPLDALRESVVTALLNERAARNLHVGLARLRRVYDIKVDDTQLDLAGDAPQLRAPSS